MYTFATLGKNLGLGNALFQYAAILGVGTRRRGEIAIPATGLSISRVFPKLSAHLLESFCPQYWYDEPSYSFNPCLWAMPDGSDFCGYFQSPLYFSHCESALRREFVFNEQIEEEASKFIQGLGERPLCAMHIRRGDYLPIASYHHHLTFENYYAGALQFIRKQAADSRVLVFSDDTSYCRENLSSEFVISEGRSAAVDLCIMSKCPYHIIANSTFSWWGAWLSGSATVVAPKTWHGPAGPPDWDTVYCSHWVTL